jgi:DNA-binding LacI/PurR family transcriptional regulator
VINNVSKPLTRVAPSVRKVAQRAGVSIATVSRALNNPETVAPPTRERVLQIAADMGYKPSTLGRNLVTGRSHLIALLIPNIGSPLYGDMAKGIEDVLMGTGLQVVLASTRDDPELELLATTELLEHSVDSGIVINSRAGDSSLLEAHSHWVHISPESPTFPMRVELDNYAGGRLAVQHLVDLGHRNIAHIAGPLREGKDRERGWRDELEANSLPLGLRAAGDYTLESGIAAVKEMLGHGTPDAIFAAGDLMAVGALQALTKAGLRVPQDVSLVGFDDAEYTTFVQPSLTTVQQPGYVMGKKAADLVLRHLAGEEPTIVFLHPKIIERDSTAPR